MPGLLHFPFDCFAGLATASGAEVGAAGYVRQPCTLDLCDDGITLSNIASLQWPHATQSWGAINTVQLWDQVANGTLLSSLSPGAPVTINQYDIARIPASGITAAYDLLVRSYGTGGFGTYAYGTYRVFNQIGAVVLQRGFDQQDVCEPGTWTPGPFSLAA